MRKRKPAVSSLCTSRKIVMPEDINPHGTLFGGVIMTWIDKIAFMCAQNFAECKTVVTVNIDQIEFIKPAFMGDHIVLSALVVSVGNTSMEIDVTLQREVPEEQIKELMSQTSLTFVAFKKDGSKHTVPELILETTKDLSRYKNAQMRIKRRKILKEELEKEDNSQELPPLANQLVLSYLKNLV